MPDAVRRAVFQRLWAEQCDPATPSHDAWRTRDLLLESMTSFVLALPDLPSSKAPLPLRASLP